MKKWIFLLLFSCLFSSEKKTICLNMIVKNESQVIGKCLASVKPLIDYWVIVDTGSSDGTQKIIQEFLKEIPGELHERAWIDFAHNRNEALDLAKGKGDYLLLIDADEIIQTAPDFFLPPLELDLYYIPVCQIGAAKIKRNGLIKNSLNWRWEGVLHETLSCSNEVRTATLDGIVNLCNTHAKNASGRSSRSEEAKYLSDAKTLEAALEKEPKNSRYAYYLGISYLAAKKYDLAKRSFEKRLKMESQDVEETFFAFYNLGLVEEKLGDTDRASQAFLNAYAFRSTRAEPLFQLAKIYRKQGNLPLSYIMVKQALTLPYPKEDYCVDYTIYDYALLIEYANSALLLGKFDEGLVACRKLLANPDLPDQYRSSIEANFALAKLKTAS